MRKNFLRKFTLFGSGTQLKLCPTNGTCFYFALKPVKSPSAFVKKNLHADNGQLGTFFRQLLIKFLIFFLTTLSDERCRRHIDWVDISLQELF